MRLLSCLCLYIQLFHFLVQYSILFTLPYHLIAGIVRYSLSLLPPMFECFIIPLCLLLSFRFPCVVCTLSFTCFLVIPYVFNYFCLFSVTPVLVFYCFCQVLQTLPLLFYCFDLLLVFSLSHLLALLYFVFSHQDYCSPIFLFQLKLVSFCSIFLLSFM